jgi:sugar lactone lactonase YvrE
MKPLLRSLLVLTVSSMLACSSDDSSSLPPGNGSDGGPVDSSATMDGTAPSDAATGPDATIPDAEAGMVDASEASANDAETPNDATSDADGAPAIDSGSPDSGPSDDAASGDAGAGSDDGAASGDGGASDASASSDDAGDANASPDDAGDANLLGSGDASDSGPSIDAGPPPDAGTIDFVTGVTVSTLAGSAVAGSQNGTGSAAQFDNPTGIAIDAQGNLLVTDYDGALVRRVTPQGAVTTLAAASNFIDPFAAVVATDGTYYVQTDANNAGVKNGTSGTIWRVIPLDDGGIATPVVVAQGFGRPRGLAPIDGGNLFVSDKLLNIVETLVVANGTTSFLAGAGGDGGFANGTGTGAQFNSPIGVASLADGSVLVADTNNNCIRLVDPSGSVTTFAGDGAPGVNDGPVLTAEFNSPRAVAVDASGNVYVSDAGNHRIRRIRADGNVDTLAGDGTAGFNDGVGQGAEFYGQEGIAVTPDGTTVYVADGNSGDGSAYNRVRAIAVP